MSDSNNEKNMKGKGALKLFVLTIVLVILTNAVTGAAMYFMGKFTFVPTPVIRQDLNVDYDVSEDILAKLSGAWISNIVEVKTTESLGTGIIMEYDEGRPIIMTNFHVISVPPHAAENVLSASNIRVAINGSLNTAIVEILGYNINNDIAVLRLKNPVQIPDAFDLYGKLDNEGNKKYIADSGVTAMGQRVLALGNALGNGIAAADGIVSKPEVVINTGKKFVSVVQTTAPINSGNSGGALIDMKGRLVGVNTYQAHKTSGDDYVDNISYAVPANIAIAIYENIKGNPSGGEADLFDVTMTGFSELSCKEDFVFKGDIVKEAKIHDDMEVHLFTVRGSAYDKYLKNGDIITMVNGVSFLEFDDDSGEPVSFSCNYSALIAALYKSGDEVKISLIKSGDKLTAAKVTEHDIARFRRG